jgi:hypothetical protein
VALEEGQGKEATTEKRIAQITFPAHRKMIFRSLQGRKKKPDS